MAQTIRVTKPGYEALTEANLYNYSLYADSDNILIKEQSRGSGNVDLFSTAEITHSLTYIPFFLVYTEVSSGRYRVSNNFNPVGSGWKSYVDTSKLYIQNDHSSTYKGYKYFIFYDDMD